MTAATQQTTPAAPTREQRPPSGMPASSARAALKVQLRAQSFDEGARALSPDARAATAARPSALQLKDDDAPAAPAPAQTAGEPVDARVEKAEGPVHAGDLATTCDPLDLEGNEYAFRFRNSDVYECLRYLIGEWAGESDVDALLVLPPEGDPKWIPVVRYRSLATREKPGADRTAAVADKMIAALEKNPPIVSKDDERLSQVHKDVLDQAERRMGTSHARPLSKEEKAKGRVDLFESKANKDGRVSKNGGTSCGLLPGTVMKNAGVMPDIKTVKGDPARLTGPGVAGMRDEAAKIGAWHVAGKTDLPKPGSPYMLSSDSAGKAVEHVGIINEIDVPDSQHGLVWKTMDAGQGGDGYCAEHVTRKVERRADGVWLINTLPGQLGDPSKWRKIVGWVDLDKVMAEQEAQKAKAAAKQPGAGNG
jgi:hypothetical protein